MKHTPNDAATNALFDEYRTLVGAEMGDFLQLYLTSLERDAELGALQGELERAEQAEEDILETLRDARRQVERLKQRFADQTALSGDRAA